MKTEENKCKRMEEMKTDEKRRRKKENRQNQEINKENQSKI